MSLMTGDLESAVNSLSDLSPDDLSLEVLSPISGGGGRLGMLSLSFPKPTLLGAVGCSTGIGCWIGKSGGC